MQTTKAKATKGTGDAMFNTIHGVVGRVFELMEIAEEEMARAGVSKTGSFMALEPGPFTRVHVDMYRHHARELCERMKRGDALELGTDAEVMLSMMDASLRSPLTRSGQAVYEWLFHEIMSKSETRAFGKPAAETYPGQVREDVRAAKVRLRRDRRG